MPRPPVALVIATVRSLAAAGAAAALIACGGKGAATSGAGAVADGDPLVLLPGSAIVVASLDVRAMYASGSVGGTVASFTDSFVPLGSDSGFDASRDVDRLVLGSYAGNQADVAVVLSGRFDVGKIVATGRAKNGATFVHGTYAGFATDTAGSITIAPLTAKTLVAGTTDRVHLVLDRLSQPAIERAMPPWAAETLASQGAQFAIAGDFASQPIASATLGSISLSWLKGLQAVRVIGDFDAPGVNVAATLTYGDPTAAQGATDGIHLIDGWQKLLAPLLLGAKVQNLQVGNSGNDVSCKFAVDDASLRALLTLASRYFQPPPQ
jgi:hypothetical protein